MDIDAKTSARILSRLARLATPEVRSIPGISEFLDSPIDTEEEARRKLGAVLQTIPNSRGRKTLLKLVKQEIVSERRSLLQKRDVNRSRSEWLKFGIDQTRSIRNAVYADLFILGRPNGSMLHKFRTSMAAGDVVELSRPDKERIDKPTREEWEMITSSASVFVVQHNWAAAFNGASDYAGGEIRLPDESCVFEIRVNDLHILVFAIDIDGTIFLQHAIQSPDSWVLIDRPTAARFSGDYNPRNLFSTTNCLVRAICIGLEAEIATTEVIRAPHKLNHSRERSGRAPLSDFHIIKLARRSRPESLPAAIDHEPAYRVRLHFRRGHWRHYADHKTWIKWMLVGDPDLGFVDKEYRI